MLLTRPPVRLRLATLAAAALLAACGGGGDAAPEPEETRAQDSRTSFVPVPVDAVGTTAAGTGYPDYEADASGKPSFKAMAITGVTLPETDRWSGVLNGAAYRIEVPKNWNGKLVMYAHGYVGTGNGLVITTPTGLRRYLIEQGYAWAASSYTKNYYDVRAGLEDTNALAQAFNDIAAARGRPLAAPSKLYITGHSMGGHVTAAAVEAEAAATAVHKVKYDGAVPMCGVTGDTDLFDYFSAYQAAAQSLAGLPKYPATGWADINATVRTALFGSTTSFAAPTAQGAKLMQVVKNLTGGERPIFLQGFMHPTWTPTVWGTFGGDGTISGILNKSVLDTNRFVLQLDDDPAVSAEEKTLNDGLLRVTAATDANRLRRDGVRWVPKVNGEFSVPVLAMHTLGDQYVPFKMIQLYRERAEAKGNGARLVTRAVRGAGHCEFSWSEQTNAFKDLVNWVENGVKPAGDDVLTRGTVANANYGCTHTVNTLQAGETLANNPSMAARATLPACAAN